MSSLLLLLLLLLLFLESSPFSVLVLAALLLLLLSLFLVLFLLLLLLLLCLLSLLLPQSCKNLTKEGLNDNIRRYAHARETCEDDCACVCDSDAFFNKSNTKQRLCDQVGKKASKPTPRTCVLLLLLLLLLGVVCYLFMI